MLCSFQGFLTKSIYIGCNTEIPENPPNSSLLNSTNKTTFTAIVDVSRLAYLTPEAFSERRFHPFPDVNNFSKMRKNTQKRILGHWFISKNYSRSSKHNIQFHVILDSKVVVEKPSKQPEDCLKECRFFCHWDSKTCYHLHNHLLCIKIKDWLGRQMYFFYAILEWMIMVRVNGSQKNAWPHALTCKQILHQLKGS